MLIKEYVLMKLRFTKNNHEKPIFIHSLWRSSSTYLLNKFENLDSCITFYEPFNELLSVITDKDIVESDQEKKNILHHPGEQNKNYFYNYKFLINMVNNKPKGRGIRKYNCRFILSNYFQKKSDFLQNDYLKLLVNYSYRKYQLRPVLGFVRSLGRLHQLVKVIPAYHIVVIRDPFSQFYSGLLQQQKYSNNYFLIQYIYLLALSRHIPLVSAFCDNHKIPLLEVNSYEDFCVNYFHLEELFGNYLSIQMEAFCIVYLLSYAKSLSFADMVVSVDSLSNNKFYIKSIANLLQYQVDLVLDFNDCSCPYYKNSLGNSFFEILGCVIDRLSKDKSLNLNLSLILNLLTVNKSSYPQI